MHRGANRHGDLQAAVELGGNGVAPVVHAANAAQGQRRKTPSAGDAASLRKNRSKAGRSRILQAVLPG